MIQKQATPEQIQIVRNHLSEMEKLNYITRCKKDEPYYGKRQHGKLSISHQIKKQKDISDMKRWLDPFYDDIVKEQIMAHREDELRLILVKRFIYG